MLTNKDPPPTPGLERKGPRNMGGAEGEGKFKDLILGSSRSDVNVR